MREDDDTDATSRRSSSSISQGQTNVDLSITSATPTKNRSARVAAVTATASTSKTAEKLIERTTEEEEVDMSKNRSTTNRFVLQLFCFNNKNSTKMIHLPGVDLSDNVQTMYSRTITCFQLARPPSNSENKHYNNNRHLTWRPKNAKFVLASPGKVHFDIDPDADADIDGGVIDEDCCDNNGDDQDIYCESDVNILLKHTGRRPSILSQYCLSKISLFVTSTTIQVHYTIVNSTSLALPTGKLLEKQV